MIKKCSKKGCDIIYETNWQNSDNPQRTDGEIIRSYLHRIIIKEKIKNKGKFGVWKIIIQFLQQEIDKIEEK